MTAQNQPKSIRPARSRLELISRGTATLLRRADGSVFQSSDSQERKNLKAAAHLIHSLRHVTGIGGWIGAESQNEIIDYLPGDLLPEEKLYCIVDKTEIEGRAISLSLLFGPDLADRKTFRVELNGSDSQSDLYAGFNTNQDAVENLRDMVATDGQHKGITFEKAIAQMTGDQSPKRPSLPTLFKHCGVPIAPAFAAAA